MSHFLGRLLAPFLLLVLVSCSQPGPSQAAVTVTPNAGPTMCCGTIQTLERSFVVFEDTNHDGKRNDGEEAIENVLIVVVSNIHGSPRRDVLLTDTEGRASITVEYTHIFWVDAIAPCGYSPTTPTGMDAIESGDEIAFGFEPQSPQPGTATVRFHLWYDKDSDGMQTSNELPIAGASFVIGLIKPDSVGFRNYNWLSDEGIDDHRLVTDDQGWAEVTLGNSCSESRVWEPQLDSMIELRTVSTNPTATTEAENDIVRLVFNYGHGETVIEWGLEQFEWRDGQWQPVVPY